MCLTNFMLPLLLTWPKYTMILPTFVVIFQWVVFLGFLAVSSLNQPEKNEMYIRFRFVAFKLTIF
jgi:hypothetical protein